jgi:hypothetical protein
MYAVYSTRFLEHAGAPLARTYVVPAGKRAVVRCVNYGCYQSTGSVVYVGVNGKYVFVLPLPAATTGGAIDCRMVAYAGENILLTTQGTDVRVQVSGFLFNDPSGGREVSPLPELPGVPIGPSEGVEAA